MATDGFEPDRFSLVSSSAIFACTVGNVLSSTPMINATFGTFLIPVTREFGWSRTEFTAVLTMLSLMGLLAYPLAGIAADRFGARRVMLLGNLAFAGSMALLFFSPRTPTVFYGLYLLLGFTAAFPSTVVLAKIISGWFVKRRGLILGLTAGCGVNIGFAVLPKVSQSLIEAVGWRGAYIGLALIILVVGFPILALLREAPVVQAMGVKPVDHTGLSGRQIRATALFWILLAAVSVGTGAFAVMTVHLVAYATDKGMSPQIAIAALSARALASGLWQVVMGRLLDTTSTPRIAAPMVLVSLVGLALLVFTTTPLTWILGGFLNGVAAGAEYSLVPYALQRYFGRRAFGEVYGIVNGAMMVSVGFIPLLAAAVFDFHGSYSWAFGLVAAMTVLSGVLLFGLPVYDKVAGKHDAEPGGAPAEADGLVPSERPT